MYAVTIEIFSFFWFLALGSYFLLALLFFLLCRKRSLKAKITIAQLLGALIAIDMLVLQIYMLNQGDWQFSSSLPLYYCNIMAMVASFALLTKKQWVYEVSLYLGFLGPLQGILTPGFANGIHGYYGISYFIHHGITVFAPIYLTYILGMRPRRGAWWRSPLGIYWFILPIYALNEFSGGNYVFLRERPPIDHICNVGPWPLYIFFWLLLLTLASFCIEKIVLWKRL